MANRIVRLTFDFPEALVRGLTDKDWETCSIPGRVEELVKEVIDLDTGEIIDTKVLKSRTRPVGTQH